MSALPTRLKSDVERLAADTEYADRVIARLAEIDTAQALLLAVCEPRLIARRARLLREVDALIGQAFRRRYEALTGRTLDGFPAKEAA